MTCVKQINLLQYLLSLVVSKYSESIDVSKITLQLINNWSDNFVIVHRILRYLNLNCGGGNCLNASEALCKALQYMSI